MVLLGNGDQDNKPDQERRQEFRFPVVGIELLYSPTQKKCLDNTLQEFYAAAGANMNLSGIAFDVDRPLRKGQRLLIMVASPIAEIGENILAEVRWCKKSSEGFYRVGVAIHESEQVYSPEINNEIQSEPIGRGPRAPAEIVFVCPACHAMVTFNLIGVQNGIWSKGIVPLYTCSSCGSTQTITTILAYNRKKVLQN